MKRLLDVVDGLTCYFSQVFIAGTNLNLNDLVEVISPHLNWELIQSYYMQGLA